MSNNIVMAFSPWSMVGCLLKEAYKGGDGWHTRKAPELRPWPKNSSLLARAHPNSMKTDQKNGHLCTTLIDRGEKGLTTKHFIAR